MKVKIASLTTLVILLFSGVAVFSVQAIPSDSMWIEPANLNFDTKASPVGAKFNVTIWLNMTTPANSWQFYLIYNKSHINVTRCFYSGVGQSQWSGALPVNTVEPGFGQHNATFDYVVFGEVLKNSAVKTGSGSLSWVEFQIIQAPPEGEALTSELRLDLKGVFRSQVMDINFNRIPLTFGKAIYFYSAPWTPPPPAKIFVEPSMVMNRSLTPGNTSFTIAVKIAEATNVSLFDFKLNFDSTILKASVVTFGDFFPSSTTPTIEIDNTTGFVHIYASLAASEAAKSGIGTLATIEFHVEALGYTSLRLSDIQLKDKKSHMLPFNSTDGYFTNSALLGDVNGDGVVDISDIAVVAGAFGSYAGHSKWNPAADVDKDGWITVMDVALVSQNFGQHHA